MARVGAMLILLGVLTAGFGASWQLGVLPGSRVVLPAPVALAPATPQPPTPIALLAPTIAPIPTLAPAATVAPTRVPVFTPSAMHLAAADVVERSLPRGSYAVRLTIPSIQLDTPVEQGGIVADPKGGEPEWETRAFVAVHYGDLTARVGQPGNAVIAGHVVTISEGNVFRFLYKVNLGDDIRVWDQADREHAYAVVEVRLVPPSDTSVMNATLDETLTLITCGGTFDPKKREFSDRLIVTAKPVSARPPGEG